MPALQFETIPADIDERAVQQASSLSAPGDIAALLAREKALWVSSRQPGKFVIGADQTLALGDAAFQQTGRPRAGRGSNCVRWPASRHELHSAVAVARDGKILFADVAMAA